LSSLMSGAIVWLLFSMIGKSLSLLAILAACGGYFYPELWLREVTERRKASILKTLPFYLDIITLSVEAGSNLTGGLTQAVQKSSDSPLRRELSRVLRDVRAGKSRSDALRDMSDRSGSTAVTHVVGSGSAS